MRKSRHRKANLPKISRWQSTPCSATASVNCTYPSELSHFLQAVRSPVSVSSSGRRWDWTTSVLMPAHPLRRIVGEIKYDGISAISGEGVLSRVKPTLKTEEAGGSPASQPLPFPPCQAQPPPPWLAGLILFSYCPFPLPFIPLKPPPSLLYSVSIFKVQILQ